MSSDEEEDRSGLKFSFDNGVPSPSSLNNIQNDDQSAPTHHTAESQQTIHLLSFKLPFAGIPTMQAFEWWHQVNYINTISIAQKLIAGIVDDAERDYNEAISWRRNASRGDQSNAAMPEHGSTTNRTKILMTEQILAVPQFCHQAQEVGLEASKLLEILTVLLIKVQEADLLQNWNQLGNFSLVLIVVQLKNTGGPTVHKLL
jgi:hypothetical protein